MYALSHTQAPPQVANSCLNNISEGQSSSIPTLDHHHPDTNSSNHESNLTTVGVPTTQGYAISNSSIVTQKSDQLPACASPGHNQANRDQSNDDDKECQCKLLAC